MSANGHREEEELDKVRVAWHRFWSCFRGWGIESGSGAPCNFKLGRSSRLCETMCRFEILQNFLLDSHWRLPWDGIESGARSAFRLRTTDNLSPGSSRLSAGWRAKTTSRRMHGSFSVWSLNRDEFWSRRGPRFRFQALNLPSRYRNYFFLCLISLLHLSQNILLDLALEFRLHGRKKNHLIPSFIITNHLLIMYLNHFETMV